MIRLVWGVDGCRDAHTRPLLFGHHKQLSKIRQSDNPNPYRMVEAVVKGGLEQIANGTKAVKGDLAYSRLRWDDAILVLWDVMAQSKKHETETSLYKCPICDTRTTRAEEYGSIPLVIPADSPTDKIEIIFDTEKRVGDFSAMGLMLRWPMLQDYINVWNPTLDDLSLMALVVRHCTIGVDGNEDPGFVKTVKDMYLPLILDQLSMEEFQRLSQQLSQYGLQTKTHVDGVCGHEWEDKRNLRHFFASAL